MRLRTPILGLLLLSACGQGPPPPAPSSPSGPSASQGQLPLEVLGPDGTRVDLTVTLARPASTLWLRVHNLQSEEEGHLEVDGGSPIPLDHTHSRIVGPGDPAILERLGADTHPDGSPSHPNGGINGEIAVFDLSLSLPLTAGTHRLSFVLDHAPGISSGYRVVRLDLRDGAGRSVLATPLREEDPANWTPPLASPQEITTGKALWNGAASRTSFRDPTPLRAHCGSCHAPDGRDLKYFNYSNRAIVVRAMFHGLSAKQGEEIASYIGTLPAYASPYARPWNPPYQPGPGLDSHPVQDWAAGAGIDAVVSSDEETGAHLRPEDLATEGFLNVRELPISLQLPDWNHWLPRVAPEDLFGAGYDGISAIAAEIEAGLERNPLGFTSCKPQPGSARGGLPSDFEQRLFRLQLYYHGDQGPGLKSGVELVRQLLEYARWRVVRGWYWMQAYGLEDKREQMAGCFTGAHPERTLLYTPPDGVEMPSLPPRVEPRSWPGALVFEMGHAIFGEGQRLAALRATATASLETDQYIMDVWYWLPLLLTPGNGVGAGNVPIDYGYPSEVFMRTGGASTATWCSAFTERSNGTTAFRPTTLPGAILAASRVQTLTWPPTVAGLACGGHRGAALPSLGRPGPRLQPGAGGRSAGGLRGGLAAHHAPLHPRGLVPRKPLLGLSMARRIRKPRRELLGHRPNLFAQSGAGDGCGKPDLPMAGRRKPDGDTLFEPTPKGGRVHEGRLPLRGLGPGDKPAASRPRPGVRGPRGACP